MAKFIPVEPEKWAEMVKAAAASDYWRIEAETDHARWLRTMEENEKLRAEVERLRNACKLVFDESAKRKFLMCYRGDDFFVSLQAMEAMSEALGYGKSKEDQQ